MLLRERAAVATEVPMIEAGNSVVNWRYTQLVEHGLDPDRANVAALDKAFDIEQFRALRHAGCTPDLAYEIVR